MHDNPVNFVFQKDLQEMILWPELAFQLQNPFIEYFVLTNAHVQFSFTVKGTILPQIFWQANANLRPILGLTSKDKRNQKIEGFSQNC